MHIAHITYAIVEPTYPISALAEKGELSLSESALFEKMMGLKYAARDATSNHEILLCDVFKKFLLEYAVNVRKIRYVLFAHTADGVAPENNDILTRFIKKYELRDADYFSATAHKCASAFQLLALSKNLFEQLKNDETILLLTADSAFTKILQTIPGSTVLSDGAAAVFFKKTPGLHAIIDILIEEEGKYAKGLLGDKNEQAMFLNNYSQKVTALIKTIVDRNGLAFHKISAIFPNNVNTLSWKQIAHHLNISFEKIYTKNIPRYAHCFGADPFINLKDGITEGVIKPGDYYLLVTVGLGATFSVILMQY